MLALKLKGKNKVLNTRSKPLIFLDPKIYPRNIKSNKTEGRK